MVDTFQNTLMSFTIHWVFMSNIFILSEKEVCSPCMVSPLKKCWNQKFLKIKFYNLLFSTFLSFYLMPIFARCIRKKIKTFFLNLMISYVIYFNFFLVEFCILVSKTKSVEKEIFTKIWFMKLLFSTF